MTKQERETYRAECMRKLGKLCPRGTAVYTVCDYCRGCRRWVRLFVAPKRGEIQEITGWVAEVDKRQFQNDRNRYGIVCDGGNYDAAHGVVYDLAWTLFGKDGTGFLTQVRLV